MIYKQANGIPGFECIELKEKKTPYCICIPVINEGIRIKKELARARRSGVHKLADIIICDGGSDDGSVDPALLSRLGVNTLLTKLTPGKQGAQLRMGFWWALQRGYDGIITIDGNNKDSIEDIPRFIDKLQNGVDFIQGSRFIRGGHAVNTPIIRYLSVRLLHAPIISLTARHWFTDTTNAYRAYSRNYLTDPRVQPLRDIFVSYELLAYLSVRATQINLTACEVPVTRAYPKKGKTPTKISFFRGNYELLKVLFKNFLGAYRP
ncbi:MAG: glycosyltransferase family 2 protein [Lachnospiraceae bacterium]|jgi:glycosyltransferase involved in cell wall biosynthesis|nr:glycosyltransferase family 2 protein [Lachnospiraceae bacterium]